MHIFRRDLISIEWSFNGKKMKIGRSMEFWWKNWKKKIEKEKYWKMYKILLKNEILSKNEWNFASKRIKSIMLDYYFEMMTILLEKWTISRNVLDSQSGIYSTVESFSMYQINFIVENSISRCSWVISYSINVVVTNHFLIVSIQAIKWP